MSDPGIFGSRLMVSDTALRKYNEALRFFMNNKNIRRDQDVSEETEKILNVVEPISRSLEGDLPKSKIMSEGDIINRLRDQHPRNWPSYQNKIVQIESKLKSEEFQVTEEDIQVLNDIGDALDTVCERLFHRMHERR